MGGGLRNPKDNIRSTRGCLLRDETPVVERLPIFSILSLLNQDGIGYSFTAN